MCASYSGDSALAAAMASALAEAGDASGEGPARLPGWCAYVTSLDAVRGLRTVSAGGSRKALNRELWEAWEGAYDPATGTTMSRFTAFHFASADSTSVDYNYVAYFNLTGLAGVRGGFQDDFEAEEVNVHGPTDSSGYLVAEPVTGTMLLLQAAMNAAVVKEHTGLDLETDTKTFPELLDKCAYDLFGCASINDFIASVFLPYIFLIYVYVIQGLVVFEKSSHLRDIMVMSGLKMNVYWVRAHNKLFKHQICREGRVFLLVL